MQSTLIIFFPKTLGTSQTWYLLLWKNPTSLKFIPNVPCSAPINQVIDLGKRDTSHHFHFLPVPTRKRKCPNMKKYIPINRRKDPTSRRSCVSSSVFLFTLLFSAIQWSLSSKNSTVSDKRRKTLHIFRRWLETVHIVIVILFKVHSPHAAPVPITVRPELVAHDSVGIAAGGIAATHKHFSSEKSKNENKHRFSCTGGTDFFSFPEWFLWLFCSVCCFYVGRPSWVWQMLLGSPKIDDIRLESCVREDRYSFQQLDSSPISLEPRDGLAGKGIWIKIDGARSFSPRLGVSVFRKTENRNTCVCPLQENRFTRASRETMFLDRVHYFNVAFWMRSIPVQWDRNQLTIVFELFM